MDPISPRYVRAGVGSTAYIAIIVPGREPSQSINSKLYHHVSRGTEQSYRFNYK